MRAYLVWPSCSKGVVRPSFRKGSSKDVFTLNGLAED
jgi:hypothetical protein